MFHKLLFLGPGGRTVFQGTVDEATDYFKKLGFVVPPNINPADFYMDVIGGVDHEGTDDFNPNVLFDAWTRHNLELDANANVSADDIEVEPKSTTLYRTKGIRPIIYLLRLNKCDYIEDGLYTTKLSLFLPSLDSANRYGFICYVSNTFFSRGVKILKIV